MKQSKAFSIVEAILATLVIAFFIAILVPGFLGGYILSALGGNTTTYILCVILLLVAVGVIIATVIAIRECIVRRKRNNK